MSYKYNIKFFELKHFNKNLVLFLIFVYLFTCIKILNAQVTPAWQWSHPKLQGNQLLWCKVFDDNTWYMAGGTGTFMKTTNGGTSWYITNNAARRSSPLETNSVVRDAFFFNEDKGIFATTWGLMLTTNAGVSFDSIPGTFYFDWRTIYFADNNTGYAASANGKVIKTINGGISWINLSSAPSNQAYYSSYTNDSLVILGTDIGVIERSSDAGITWQQIQTGSSGTIYKIAFINNDTGFICGRYATLSMTTDAGLTWNMRNNNLPNILFLDVDLKNTGSNTEIYLTGSPYYIYKSEDLGMTWDTIPVYVPGQFNLLQNQYNFATGLGGNMLVTVGWTGEINKVYNGQVIAYSNIVKTGTNYDVWAESGNGKVWAVGAPSLQGSTFDQVIYSPDGGNSWTVQPTNSTATFNSIWMLNSNTGYIAGSSGKMIKTINGGSTWNEISFPSSSNLNRVKFADVNTGWVVGDNSSVYKTTNGSLTWTQQFSANIERVQSISILNSNIAWIAGDSGGFVNDFGKVNYTTNGGLNWIEQFSNLGAIYDIQMLNASTGYICGFGAQSLFKTTNSGSSWDSVPNPQHGWFSLKFFDANTGIISNYETTQTTTNGGQTWRIDLLPGSIQATGKIYALAVDTIFAAGYWAGGVFIFKNPSPIGIINWENNIPQKYELYQNYPNPFNPSTTIKFAIPKAGNVLLKVYDITGREVNTVINNLRLNAGTVKYTFDGTNFASGVYFYSLYIDGGLISTKKMILIK